MSTKLQGGGGVAIQWQCVVISPNDYCNVTTSADRIIQIFKVRGIEKRRSI